MSQPQAEVTRYTDVDSAALRGLLQRYGLNLRVVAPGEPIPGSYWGGDEAGLIGDTLIVSRDRTPLHSVLHESCHYVCMSPDRRGALHTDAGGGYLEENAVCYLQIVLAEDLPGYDRYRMMADMDAWGYSFRLGSASAWFEGDADDARFWLVARGLIDHVGKPSYRLRDDPE